MSRRNNWYDEELEAYDEEDDLDSFEIDWKIRKAEKHQKRQQRQREAEKSRDE